MPNDIMAPPAGADLVSAAASLVAGLDDPSPDVRLRAVQTLKQFAGQLQTALTTVHASLKRAALTDADPAIRGEADLALSRDLEPLARSQVPVLISALRDELASVRFSAAAALADFGVTASSAVTSLIRLAMWDGDLRVRVQCAAALWRIDRRDRIAVPVLIEGLESDDAQAHWIAADCLGDIGAEARDAVPALRKALERPQEAPMIHRGLELALERIGATKG